MDYLLGVHVFEALEEVVDEERCILFTVAFNLFQSFIELSTTNKLHDNDYRLLCFIKFVKFNDMLICQPFMDFKFIVRT